MNSFSLYLIGMLFFSFNVIAQDMDKDAMMNAWQDYMTPGDEHKMMAGMVGEWEGDVAYWMEPGQPPQTSKSTVNYEQIYDGRYIIGKHSGEMMGMPFNGMEISGYDKAKKMFFSTWIDNMGTGLMYVEGTYNKNSNTFNYNGETVDPMGNKVKVRESIKIIDKDHTNFEMYMDMGQGEMKTMEIKYHRK